MNNSGIIPNRQPTDIPTILTVSLRNTTNQDMPTLIASLAGVDASCVGESLGLGRPSLLPTAYWLNT